MKEVSNAGIDRSGIKKKLLEIWIMPNGMRIGDLTGQELRRFGELERERGLAIEAGREALKELAVEVGPTGRIGSATNIQPMRQAAEAMRQRPKEVRRGRLVDVLAAGRQDKALRARITSLQPRDQVAVAVTHDDSDGGPPAEGGVWLQVEVVAADRLDCVVLPQPFMFLNRKECRPGQRMKVKPCNIEEVWTARETPA